MKKVRPLRLSKIDSLPTSRKLEKLFHLYLLSTYLICCCLASVGYAHKTDEGKKPLQPSEKGTGLMRAQTLLHKHRTTP